MCFYTMNKVPIKSEAFEKMQCVFAVGTNQKRTHLDVYSTEIRPNLYFPFI